MRKDLRVRASHCTYAGPLVEYVHSTHLFGKLHTDVYIYESGKEAQVFIRLIHLLHYTGLIKGRSDIFIFTIWDIYFLINLVEALIIYVRSAMTNIHDTLHTVLANHLHHVLTLYRGFVWLMAGVDTSVKSHVYG